MTVEEDKRCSVNGHDRGPKGEQKEKGGKKNRRKGEKKGGDAEKHRAEKNRKTTS